MNKMISEWRPRNESFPTSLNYTEDGFLDYGQLILENHIHPYGFENSLDLRVMNMKWVYQYWYVAPITGFVYIFVVFALQHWMRNREAFDLKRELFLWNAALGIFSIVGFIPEFNYILGQEDWFYRSLCTLMPIDKKSLFWGLMWTFSKYVELGDTIFIVLRKKPLTVIQWYHHFITMTGSWLMLPYMEPVNGYFVALNFGVHRLMYPYFAIRSLNIKILTVVANIITTLQMTQMVTALSLIFYSAVLYYIGVPCYRHHFPLQLSACVTISFNILFGIWKSLLQSCCTKKTEMV